MSRSVFQSSCVNRQYNLKNLDKQVSDLYYLPIEVKIHVLDRKGIDLINVYKYRNLVDSLNKSFYEEEHQKSLIDKLVMFVKKADYSI